MGCHGIELTREERSQELPPLPRPGREVRGKECKERALSLGEDRSGRGVRRSSSESGHRGRWSHGGGRAVAELSGRMAAKLCLLAS